MTYYNMNKILEEEENKFQLIQKELQTKDDQEFSISEKKCLDYCDEVENALNSIEI